MPVPVPVPVPETCPCPKRARHPRLTRLSEADVSSGVAPTSRALSLARRLGLTVIGFVRGRRMTVYTYPNRCNG